MKNEGSQNKSNSHDSNPHNQDQEDDYEHQVPSASPDENKSSTHTIAHAIHRPPSSSIIIIAYCSSLGVSCGILIDPWCDLQWIKDHVVTLAT